jgi:hypothetical protein
VVPVMKAHIARFAMGVKLFCASFECRVDGGLSYRRGSIPYQAHNQFTGNRLYCREAVGRIDERLMLQSVKPGSRGALLMLLRTLQLTPGSLYDWQTECPEEILVYVSWYT